MTSDPRDYKLDISSLNTGDAPSEPANPRRPFLSVLFDCCGVYSRIYRDPSARMYHGRCPKCGRPVQFQVGEGGTAVRMFRVS